VALIIGFVIGLPYGMRSHAVDGVRLAEDMTALENKAAHLANSPQKTRLDRPSLQLMLLQHRNNLLFREPCSLHLSVLGQAGL
jgi:hypothetical protein